MSGLTPKQSAELRDKAARARLDYEEIKEARRARLYMADEPPLPDAFLLAGDILEYVYALEAQVADMDNTEISRAVDVLRQRTIRVGNLLAQRRQRVNG